MGVSPSQVNCRSNSYSYPKQSTSEETPDCGAQCKCAEISEQKHQLSSESVQTKPGDAEHECAAIEALQSSTEDGTKYSLTACMYLPPQGGSKSILMNGSSSPKLNADDQKLECISEDRKISQFDKGSCPTHSTPKHKLQSPSDGAFCEPSEGPELSKEIVKGESVKISTVISNGPATEHLEEPPALAASSSPVKQLGLPPDREINVLAAKKRESALLDVDKHWNLEQLETPSKDTVKSSGRVKPTPKSSREKHRLRPLINSDRVLRSRSQEKPKAPEPSVNVADVNPNVGKTRKQKKKKQQERVEADEYSRIRKHLRYLLNRISYEQSLITAYSAEGWKGLSLEKLKPEKELQRATSEIVRRKLKIRDLFQRIDSLCTEGRLSESLFDSEGQISSEDIFCAKCGSKELTPDNDIILCDGSCDRGFHQFCLVPPLLKKDIPPDDEGWLCPGCDCKVDCIELLNESQGTNISVSDRWEKVFPEAAAAGQNPDQNLGLPSDDSDDNDYDPDSVGVDEESKGDESSSDDSDFTSEELEAEPTDKHQVGLSSDDSEDDDDFDPDASDVGENVNEESSSSDFTSASDDLATFDNDKLSGEVESSKSISRGHSIRKGSNCGGEKQFSHGELLSTLEPNADEDKLSPISAKRNVERLDYKKLYDETYGNGSSDSSDDEDFTDAVGPRNRRNGTESASASEIGNIPVIKGGNQEQKVTKYTPKRVRQRSKSDNISISPTTAHEGSLPSSSSGKKVRQSAYKRLGEAASQGLHKSFKENQYPDRATKERLAKELGITFQQVNKWFDNTRWSFNHPPSTNASAIKTKSYKNSSVPKTIAKPPEPENGTVGRVAVSGGGQSMEPPEVRVSTTGSHIEAASKSELANRDNSIPKSKTPRLGKRKRASDH